MSRASAALLLPAVVYVGGGVWVLRRLMHEVATAPPLLHETLQELMRDRDALRRAMGGAADGAHELVLDLGAALVSADLTRGERLFASQCSTCHTINPGGANGTGDTSLDTRLAAGTKPGNTQTRPKDAAEGIAWAPAHHTGG